MRRASPVRGTSHADLDRPRRGRGARPGPARRRRARDAGEGEGERGHQRRRPMASRRPARSAAGEGGQPGITASTGTTAATPPTTAYEPAEDAAVAPAVAGGDDELGIGRRLPRAAERLRHVQRDGSGDEQAVGVARRGDEAEAEALQIVVRAGEPADLELAAVAGAGVHLADVQRAAEQAAHLGVEPRAHFLEDGIPRGRLGDDAGSEPDAQLPDHRRRGMKSAKPLTIST